MVVWPVAYVGGPEGCPAYEHLPYAQIAEFEQIAVDYLWAWTGKVFGATEVTVRPCRGLQREGTWVHRPTAVTSQTAEVGWFAVSADCAACPGACSCKESSAVLKLRGPVSEIKQVTIEGTVLDPSAYRVDNRHLLVRQDGLGWPLTQSLDAPLGSENTWAVTYVFGIPVPMGGQQAAGLLACELAKQATNDNTCQLPRRFQAITRQGVTVAALDTFEDIDQGHTGIWSIDAWIASVTKPRQRSTVMSPDLPRMRRQTWP